MSEEKIMDEVEAFIWHDEQGTIVAVGHAVGVEGEQVEPLAAEGHKIVRARLPLERLSKLHLTHAVDPRGGQLVERRSAA